MFITPQTSQGPSTEAVPSNSTNEANQTSTGESVSEIWFVIPQGASLSKEDQTITINEGTIPRDQISIKNLDGRSLWKPAKYGNSLVDKLSALSLPFRPERKPKVQKKSLTTMLSAPILAKCIPVDSAWEVNEDSKFSCNLPDNIKEILKFKKDDKNKDIKTKEINLSFIGKDEESKNFFECMNEKKLDAETTKLKGPLEGKSIPMSESALKKDKILRDRLNKAVSASTVLDLAKEMLSSKNLIKLELSNSALELATSALEIATSSLDLATSALELATCALELSNSALELATSALELSTSALEITTSTLELATSALEITTSALELANSALEITTVELQLATSALN